MYSRSNVCDYFVTIICRRSLPPPLPLCLSVEASAVGLGTELNLNSMLSARCHMVGNEVQHFKIGKPMTGRSNVVGAAFVSVTALINHYSNESISRTHATSHSGAHAHILCHCSCCLYLFIPILVH